MSEPRIIQNFIGYRATIATEQPAAVEQLQDMLTKLGIAFRMAEVGDGEAADGIGPTRMCCSSIRTCNVAVETGALEPSRCLPVIGIIGVEAPSRLAR